MHFELDVLDVNLFRSPTFSKPGAPALTEDDIQPGCMMLAQVVKLLSDVAVQVDVFGLGITEYTPWDAIALLELPIVGKTQ